MGSKPTRTDRQMQKRLAEAQGLRFNGGKTLLELVPPEWVWGLGDVTTRGSWKYPLRNWEKGMKWSIMIGCSLRHIFKFCCGERYDPETGCHHLFMAAWNCCALASYDLRGVGENDIPESDVSILARVNSGEGTLRPQEAA